MRPRLGPGVEAGGDGRRRESGRAGEREERRDVEAVKIGKLAGLHHPRSPTAIDAMDACHWGTEGSCGRETNRGDGW